MFCPASLVNQDTKSNTLSETNNHSLILQIFIYLFTYSLSVLFVYCLSSPIECKLMREGTYPVCSLLYHQHLNQLLEIVGVQ